MINMIWAQGLNGEIGCQGKMPWHLPEDMKHFKETTMGSVVVMGRKTFESIGGPLEGRENVVLTRDPYWVEPGIWVYDNHIQLLNDLGKRNVFIIGGAQIYDLFMPFAQRLYVTFVQQEFEADTYAPKILPEFIPIEFKEHTGYNFSVFERITNWRKLK